MVKKDERGRRILRHKSCDIALAYCWALEERQGKEKVAKAAMCVRHDYESYDRFMNVNTEA